MTIGLPLDVDMLRAAYAYLNETPPFNRWNLPDADEVTFRVVRDRSGYGWHKIENGHHTIAVSRLSVAHTGTLIATMAHEMIHMHEKHDSRVRRANDIAHGESFDRHWRQVARYHGFDPLSR